MSIPPQQQPQGGLPPPSSQQQAQAGGVPVGQGQPPPTGTGDGWRTPEKRQLVIRKISEAVTMFPNVLQRNPVDVETSIFTRAKSEHEYMNMVGKIVLSIRHKGLMQQQQQAAAAGGGGGGTGWTGQGGMEWGMRPNLPPQPGGGYPSFPPGGHMLPYGGMPPRMIPSYPMHGPPPPHPAMQPHMRYQMSPSHNMGVMPMRQPYNMMRGAHPPPQRASLATNMVGSGEQVVSAVSNPSFPVTAPDRNVQEMQHPPGAPSPFPYPPQQIGLPSPSSQQQAVGQGQPPTTGPTGTGGGWRTPKMRQMVTRKISEAIKMFPDVLRRNSADVEMSIFTRAKSEHEYINMVGKIVLSIKHKGLQQQQRQQAAVAGGGGGGTGWTGQGGMDWGMRPNLPPQPGGGYPLFPPGGHMPPYGGMPPFIPSNPFTGPTGEQQHQQEATAVHDYTSNDLYFLPGTIKKWCEEGSIVLTLTRVHMVGPPGAGKTCTQCLLLNEDPPRHDFLAYSPLTDSHTLSKSITKSTPIACKAVKALRVSIDNDETWKVVSRDELIERLATDLKQNKISQQELPLFQESGSGGNVANKEVPQEEILNSESVLKEIADVIHNAKAQLSDRWVYIVDSGGQPAYQELLPLFTRAASLNVITIDISKGIDEDFEFMYRINGKEFKCDKKMKHSNRKIFKDVVSSITLKKPLNLAYDVSKHPQHSMNFVVGTHYDILVKEFGEKKAEDKVLQMSNELMSPRTLMPYLKSYVISNMHEDSIILPVDTLLPSKSEERAQATKKLLNTISKRVEVSLTVKLPIRCFAFELYLEEKAESKGFVTRSEAIEGGKMLYMSEADVDEALTYLHHCTIILYYPMIKPQLVFIDPQKILDVLSHLLALTYVDNESAQLLVRGIEEKEIIDLKIRGYFQEALLKKLTAVFTEEFQPEYFINLLRHLHIIAELVTSNGDVNYFIPSVLPAYDNSFNIHASKIKPLLYVWIEMEKEWESYITVPVPQGIFPLLIVHLLKQKEYVVQFPSLPDHCKYRNACMLWIFIKRRRCTLHIINQSTHIEVYFTGFEVYCPQVRELLTTAINRSSKIINVKHCHAYAFPCLNASISDTSEKCYCIVNDEDEKIVNCTLCPLPADISKDDTSYWCWFGSNSVTEVLSSAITEDVHLDQTHLHDLRMLLKRGNFLNLRWIDFGLALYLHYNTLKTIEADYPRDINSCLRECLVKWLERADDVYKNGGAKWTTLIRALEECGQSTAAEYIRCQRLKRRDSIQQADERVVWLQKENS